LFSPKKIIAVARDRKKLESLRSVDPGVIETISVVEEDLSRRLLDLTGGAGADVLLDFIPKGVETTRQAIYRMRLGGRVVLAGGCTEDLQISYRFLMRSALDFTGSRGNDYFDFPVISDFIESGRLDLSPLTIYNFPLHQVDKVVTLLTERSGDRPFWVNLIPNPDLG
jgi:alcohol dehydrogenase